MKTQQEQIISTAVEMLKTLQVGIHAAKLAKKIHKKFPQLSVVDVQDIVQSLPIIRPEEVYKRKPGVLRHMFFKEKELSSGKIQEHHFYKPFADWLVREIQECTKAIPLGGNKFKDKWGTPDVIGKREAKKSDIVKGSTEIVSAELKINTMDLITAFGQACSYKLFSHKSYIVVPKNSSQDDISKLDALCLIFGIGLVLFDNTNVKDPQFEIRVRPIRHEPDMFYVNKYMKLIEEELFG